MNDREFCIEYVRRLPRQFKTKTQIEMSKIVLQGIPVPVETMFDDYALTGFAPGKLRRTGLFHNDPITLFVYQYIRDNQHEFIQGDNSI